MNCVMPVLKLIVMKAMITAHLYMLSKFRITAMLLSFILSFISVFTGMVYILGPGASTYALLRRSRYAD